MKKVAEECPEMVIKYAKGLQVLQQQLTEPMERPELKVYVFYGATGVGKTRMAYECDSRLYSVFCTKAPWFDGYANEKVALLDDFGPGEMSVNMLKRITDRYPIRVPVKGGSVAWNPTTIIITTNYLMVEWYPKAGRLDLDALARRCQWIDFTTEANKTEFKAAWQRQGAAQRRPRDLEDEAPQPKRGQTLDLPRTATARVRADESERADSDSDLDGTNSDVDSTETDELEPAGPASAAGAVARLQRTEAVQ